MSCFLYVKHHLCQSVGMTWGIPLPVFRSTCLCLCVSPCDDMERDWATCESKHQTEVLAEK